MTENQDRINREMNIEEEKVIKDIMEKYAESYVYHSVWAHEQAKVIEQVYNFLSSNVPNETTQDSFCTYFFRQIIEQ